MLKRFTDGLIFGTGFGIAFSLVVVVAVYFVLPATMESRYGSASSDSKTQELSTAPAITSPLRFLGSPAITSGEFRKKGVLASGPGTIIGTSHVNGQPVVGLRLRLMLNGSVASQWATSDADGKYKISVPYGDYVIQGYEFDHAIANQVLAGKITYPRGIYSSESFKVAEGLPGRGLPFKFVDPVIKSFEKKQYSINEDVILEWQAYPGASHYKVQIYEKSDPYTWSNNRLFEWTEKPELLEPKMRLKDHGVKLKSGHFYVVEISALDADMHIISESARKHSGYDFEVVE